MADPKIVQYLQQYLSQGYSIEQLKQTLISKGYDPAQVEEAAIQVQQGSTSSKSGGKMKWVIIGFVIIILGIGVVYAFGFLNFKTLLTPDKSDSLDLTDAPSTDKTNEEIVLTDDDVLDSGNVKGFCKNPPLPKFATFFGHLNVGEGLSDPILILDMYSRSDPCIAEKEMDLSSGLTSGTASFDAIWVNSGLPPEQDRELIIGKSYPVETDYFCFPSEQETLGFISKGINPTIFDSEATGTVTITSIDDNSLSGRYSIKTKFGLMESDFTGKRCSNIEQESLDCMKNAKTEEDFFKCAEISSQGFIEQFDFIE